MVKLACWRCRNKSKYMGVALDGVQRFDLHRAEFAHLAEVVAPEVDEHIVLGKLLFVVQEAFFERLVLFLRFAARTGAGEGKGVQHAVFQFDERFGRGARDLDVRAGEVEHIRRGIDRAQHAVGVEQTSLKRGAQAVGEHDLENVALADVVLGGLDHRAELLFGKERRDFAEEPSEGLLLFFAGFEKGDELLQLEPGLVVADLDVAERHVDDEHDLLPHVVESDDLIEQHQIDVLEAVLVLLAAADARLAVFEIVVGEAAHKPAGEGGEVVEAGTFIAGQQLAQILGRVVRADGEAAGLQFAVDAGDLELWVKAEKGVASPAVVCLRGFEHIAVGGHIFKDAHRLDGSDEVGEDLAAQRQHVVLLRRGEVLHGFERW